MLSGLITHLQKYSLHDGPGIRTTVFLKGCPLDCWWCHNPEGQSPRPEVVTVDTRCIRCGACIRVCPQRSEASAAGHPALPEEGGGDHGSEPLECGLCGACVEACPAGARQMLGRSMSVRELLEEVRRDVVFYDQSGGGVTFSGGEPLLQAEFLLAALAACRAGGIHTAVDTCGYAPRAQLEAAARLTDLFLFDLKFIDPTRHARFTGVPNDLILENLRFLGEVHSNLWIRIPVIPGLNDQPSELEAMARLAASIPGVRQVNLLPYHRTGRAKFGRLGLAYRLNDLLPPTSAQMQSLVAAFTTAGVPAKAGG